MVCGREKLFIKEGQRLIEPDRLTLDDEALWEKYNLIRLIIQW
jgi:hypothetical protein